MFEVICVSARKQSENFLNSIENLAKSSVSAIILREKDMHEKEYLALAEDVKKICDKNGKKLIIHKFISVAKQLGIKSIHIPFSEFTADNSLHSYFEKIGTSVHSVGDAAFAEKAGADYIIAGHIFATDCKKEAPPRGTEFLNKVCNAVNIPVYAIGGIDNNSISELYSVNQPNFSGVCMMSALMKSENPQEFVNKIKEKYFMKCDRSKFLLYAVTDRHWLNGRTLEEDVEKALKGGATLVQLREKKLGFESFCNEALKIHRLCKKHGVPLIINDNIEVAKAVDAEGIHLGQDDMNISKARSILGDDKIIGATARTKEQALKAESDGADYIGSGAVFGTSTKSDAAKMSLETLKEICSSVKIPVTAIGGITKDNVLNLKDCGISGAAVVSGIFGEKDIYNSTSEIKRKIKEIVNGQ